MDFYIDHFGGKYTILYHETVNLALNLGYYLNDPDHKEMFIEFKKKYHSTIDCSGIITFDTKEDATDALDWLDSISLADKLSNQEESLKLDRGYRIFETFGMSIFNEKTIAKGMIIRDV